MWDPQYSLLVHQKEEFKQKLDNTNHRSMKIHDFSCNSPVERDIITQSYFWTGNMVELVREKIKKNSRIIHKDQTVHAGCLGSLFDVSPSCYEKSSAALLYSRASGENKKQSTEQIPSTAPTLSLLHNEQTLLSTYLNKIPLKRKLRFSRKVIEKKTLLSWIRRNKKCI